MKKLKLQTSTGNGLYLKNIPLTWKKNGEVIMKAFLILVVCLLLCCPVANAQTVEQAKKQQVIKALNGPHGAQIKASTKKYSVKYGIDEKLILAVIMTESGFNPYAGSSGGCMGLMQLSPTTFRARQVGTNIYNIDQNIHAGVKHLAGLKCKYHGDTRRMLAAYNYGGGRIYANKPIPLGALKYINHVYYHKLIIDSLKLTNS